MSSSRSYNKDAVSLLTATDSSPPTSPTLPSLSPSKQSAHQVSISIENLRLSITQYHDEEANQFVGFINKLLPPVAHAYKHKLIGGKKTESTVFKDISVTLRYVS